MLDTIHICQLVVDALIFKLTKILIFQLKTVFRCCKASSNKSGETFHNHSNIRAADTSSRWFHQVKVLYITFEMSEAQGVPEHIPSTFILKSLCSSGLTCKYSTAKQ